jgi:hypothetical protein
MNFMDVDNATDRPRCRAGKQSTRSSKGSNCESETAEAPASQQETEKHRSDKGA